ncbi:hypothetical protein ACFOD0_02895 [Shewanella intestini]|uniref:Uncharacterized protein n=1 Tax=Shewanella intestini TaxID=2017544 RepID=A0ABS5I1P8_9GAMM|nr:MULTISPECIES: hypothetical protein [Shewanella]MBR9727946.1 hypothetical protein [Shewanella intestini]MRG36503.1 hypothetical protein [Shewanella sp. XMDDZSB0408]
MKTICFNIINAAATHLPGLHQLSDAGAGANLMHLTPTRDTEIIVSGQARTPLPNNPQKSNGLLPNQGISPAVLTHGLLRMFYQAGYQIQINSFNVNTPLPNVNPQPWLSVNRHVGGLGVNKAQLISEHLMPTLAEQARLGHISILAECGVGGTTFSTLWLRLLTGLRLSPAGSTQAPDKLTAKAKILDQLEQDYLRHHVDFNQQTLLDTPDYHDDIQATICALIAQWPTGLTLPYFAGGMMFVAPLLALRHSQLLTQAISVSTTRWVLNGDGRQVLNYLNANDTINTNSCHFSRSYLRCLNVFEQGKVVEGCGLGGCLILAEQLGWAEQQIIQSLEQTVLTHLSHFQQRNVA